MCNNKKSSRRDFLSLLGTATTLPLLQSPVQILIESILLGVSQKAAAAESGIVPRRYLNISFEGAPPRWTHDLFLTPYSTAGFVTNLSVATKYGGSSFATSSDYVTIPKKGINVPYLWQFNVPKAGGGTRPMDELLNNMLNIRGIHIGNPDHGAAAAMQFMPPGALKSISALSADNSSMPIAAVNGSLTQYKFQSTKAKTSITVNSYGNMLNKLLTPFNKKNLGAFTTKRNDLSAALDASIGVLNTYAESMHPGAKALSSSMSDANDLLSAGFGDLTTVWDTLFNKYTSLITAALSPSQNLIGINDKPIISDGSDRYLVNSALVPTDLRLMITSATTIQRMASHFAMAEYVLVNNLSSSVAISPNKYENLSVNNENVSTVDFDEHHTGAMTTLLLNSYYNLAYSACLLELIDQLKAKSIFQDTVIVTGGEFGRNARTSGSGSDHGYLGGSSTIYCGAITGPLVLGNIYNNKAQQPGADSGTWGYAAPVTELGKHIELSHLSSTIAFLLRTESPVTAAPSLITTSGGTLIPTIEKAKQV